MKRLVSQKIRAMASPGLAANSRVHQQCKQIRVIHQVLDLRCAAKRTAGNGLVNLGSRQLSLDATSIPKEPNPGPLHRIRKRQPRGRLKLLSLIALDSMPD